jgi:hypothetical protein
LSGRNLALLALGAGVYMASIAIAQALIALRGHVNVAIGWTAGVASLFAALAMRAELMMRVSVALIIGPAVALVFFGISLRNRLHAGAAIDAGSLTEALHELP